MIDAPGESPAGKVMNEAVEAAIAEEPICPEASAFINAGTPLTDRQIREALDRGFAAVVVTRDGSTEILHPESASN
jgi:hypothetical protein